MKREVASPKHFPSKHLYKIFLENGLWHFFPRKGPSIFFSPDFLILLGWLALYLSKYNLNNLMYLLCLLTFSTICFGGVCEIALYSSTLSPYLPPSRVHTGRPQYYKYRGRGRSQCYKYWGRGRSQCYKYRGRGRSQCYKYRGRSLWDCPVQLYTLSISPSKQCAHRQATMLHE